MIFLAKGEAFTLNHLVILLYKLFRAKVTECYFSFAEII
jgi:hypothetical protein